MLRLGFGRVFVAFNERERAFGEWLGDRGVALCRESSSGLELLVEREPLGTIGAVTLLPADVENVVVVNVDNLTTLDLRELLRTHLDKEAAATIATHTQPFRMPFGMLEVEGQRVTAYRETVEFDLKQPLARVVFEQMWDRLYAADLNLSVGGGEAHR